MIEAISHITFIVSDLDRMSNFLTTIFDAQELYASNGKEFSLSREKFFRIGGLLIAIMEGDSSPEKTYNHIAFKIPEWEYDRYRERISDLGVDILPGRERVEGEGRSIYFYDFDNHLFELHTGNLDERLKVYQNDT